MPYTASTPPPPPGVTSHPHRRTSPSRLRRTIQSHDTMHAFSTPLVNARTFVTKLHFEFVVHLWASQVFHFLKTHQLAKLLASLIWLQLGQKVLTLNLIHSEELFHDNSFWTFILVSFIALISFSTEQLVVLLYLLTGQAYLQLDLIAISEHWLVYRKPTTLLAPPPPPRHG